VQRRGSPDDRITLHTASHLIPRRSALAGGDLLPKFRQTIASWRHTFRGQ
jgi:hypothetical protein